MQKVKEFVYHYFEYFFVLSILAGIFVIASMVEDKVIFLNFFFLPVIMAGYLLGLYRSVMGAVFCILVVCLYFIGYPQAFVLPDTKQGILLYLSAWGGFLILAGATVGRQQEKLGHENIEVKRLNQELSTHQAELLDAHTRLGDYSQNLEQRVQERTEELEKSKRAIEELKTKVEDALYVTMDPAVVKLIIEGRLRDEKRRVSVMFSDLVNFTSYSERLTPELVVRDLNRYLADMEPILFMYRGHIDKYMGDGIMCEFGAPLDYDQHRLMAVVAGLKMQQKLTDTNYPWKMRIGIASGQAITGIIGVKRQAYTTIGDMVNLAARLEKACPSGAVLIDGATLEGVKRFVEYRAMHDVGKADNQDGLGRERIEALWRQLDTAAGNEEKALVYAQLAQVHMALDEPAEAAELLQRAMALQPENSAIKIAFAEAAMKKSDLEKIKVKGKEQRVAVYEVLGLRDPLRDREKLPESFYLHHHQILHRIKVAEDEILRVEVLDGSLGHSKVVAVLAHAIAAQTGEFSEQELDEVLHAAYFADLGKEIISHHLLNRSPGGLSASEFDEVKKHPVESTRMLKKMGFDAKHLLEMVRHSHENYNGTGYPDGLVGKQIPLGARIILVADTYDALTSWRPYQDRWDRHAAFDELQRGVQKGLFDPDIVAKLIVLLSEP